MREILFRGKSRYTGKWYQGDLVTVAHKRFIDDDIVKERVIPETVGQYTGLTDKNGTKIFEDDIVRLYLVDDIEMGIIKFNDIMCRFMFFTKDGSYSFNNTCTFEVIGNIHDNPELLKGDQQ